MDKRDKAVVREFHSLVAQARAVPALRTERQARRFVNLVACIGANYVLYEPLIIAQAKKGGKR